MESGTMWSGQCINMHNIVKRAVTQIYIPDVISKMWGMKQVRNTTDICIPVLFKETDTITH